VVGSAYQFLYEHCGIALTRGEQTIKAVMSSEAETEVFEFAEPGPRLLMKRKTYTVAGQMIEYVEDTFRGDAYAYRLTLNLGPRCSRESFDRSAIGQAIENAHRGRR